MLIQRADEWATLAKTGHELGNHTVFHPADSRKAWVTKANAIDDYSIERMEAELRLANDWLQHLDGRKHRSFAFPCSNSTLGRPGLFRRMIRNTRLETTRIATWLDRCPGPGDTRRSYKRVTQDLFTACRGGGLTLSSQVPATSDIDRFMLPSAVVDNGSKDDIRRFIEQGLQSDSWPILQFHGVGGSHGQNCEPREFRELVQWLSTKNIAVQTISNFVANHWH